MKNSLDIKYEFKIVQRINYCSRYKIYMILLFLEDYKRETYLCGASFETRKKCREWATLRTQHILEILADIEEKIEINAQTIRTIMYENTKNSSGRNTKTGPSAR